MHACACRSIRAPNLSTPGYAVSVRELSIPPKALRAFEQGIELLAKKDAAGSLAHFQRAIQEYAGYFEAYDRMGAADLKLWRLPEAEQAFRKSIDVSGGQYAHPLLALGAILDDREKFAEAESVIRKGLDLDPESRTGHYYLALALFGLNRLVEAENSVREALRRKTDFPEAYLLLADIHSREKDYESLRERLGRVPQACSGRPGERQSQSPSRIRAGKLAQSREQHCPRSASALSEFLIVNYVAQASACGV